MEPPSPNLGGGHDEALAMLTAGIATSHLRMLRRELRRQTTTTTTTTTWGEVGRGRSWRTPPAAVDLILARSPRRLHQWPFYLYTVQ